MADHQNCDWINLADWKIEGQGWKDVPERFSRLPRSAQGKVPQPVWDFGYASTGLHVYFETDAPAIFARWTLSGEQLNEPNFPACGFSGLDLYADDGGTWRWAGAGQWVDRRAMQVELIGGLSVGKRSYLLYFPLRNRPDKVELGVPAGHRLRQIPCKSAPLVYYGTSIVHGAYASHPGLVHPSILGRWLKRPVINLGFSGAAKMEPEVAHLMAELKPAAFVLDPLANMDAALVRERAEAFLRILRKKRPETPIVLVECAPLTNLWLKPQQMAGYESLWREWGRIYRKLVKEGDARLFYARTRNAHDCLEGVAVDALHPGDLGYLSLAKKLYPTLKKALGQ